jgi:hypothetical protein
MWVDQIVAVGVSVVPEGVVLPTLVPPAQGTPNEVAQPTAKATPAPQAIELSPYMSATLEGLDFEIQPAGEQRQNVVPDAVTPWAWQVRALKPGTRLLSVRVKLYEPPNFEAFRSLPPYSIVVKAETPSVWQRLGRGWDEANKIWSAPLAAALVAGVTWFVNRFGRRSRDARSKGPRSRPHR